MSKTEWKNETNIEHRCGNGTIFESDRGDLQNGVNVSPQWDITSEKKMADFAEFGAWHATYIHPFLNGFSGYDCIKYNFSSERYPKVAYLQPWEEFERGWDSRSDGFSLHCSLEDVEDYIKTYNATLPDEAPDIYSQSRGKPLKVRVTATRYAEIKDKGVRFNKIDDNIQIKSE